MLQIKPRITQLIGEGPKHKSLVTQTFKIILRVDRFKYLNVYL